MARYKEYKKLLKAKSINNLNNFERDINDFLKQNQDIKIVKIISHKAYHITVIYEKLIPVNH